MTKQGNDLMWCPWGECNKRLKYDTQHGANLRYEDYIREEHKRFLDVGRKARIREDQRNGSRYVCLVVDRIA